MKKLRIYFVFLIFVCGYARAQSADYWWKLAQDDLKASLKQKRNVNKAKNVILFVGDGMDITTTTAARIYRGQLNGQTGEENFLNFERFPNIAMSKTYNTDRQTPDSAGTATALMCGIKTNFMTVGVDSRAIKDNCLSSKGAEVDSILHWSQAEGKSTGIITTSRITHATPAATYAHSPQRNWEGDREVSDTNGNCKDIAYQLVHNNSFINVIFGGGRRYFLREDDSDPKTGVINDKGGRKDGRNLIQDWKDEKSSRGASHNYVWNKQQFDSLDALKTDYVLGLFNSNHMEYEQKRDTGPSGEPSLAEMTRKGIEVLQKNDKGFFLMVEGARIDHGHHASVAKTALHETLTLEDAVGEAVRMTDEKDTLIVVTADHSHVFNMAGYPKRGNNILGIVDPIDFPPDDDLPYATLLYGNGPGYDWGNRTNFTTAHTSRDGYIRKSAVPLGAETHGGQDVAIYARGPMAHLFHGVHEQNYIPHVMAYASCVGENKDHCSYPPYTSTATGARMSLSLCFTVAVVIIGELIH